jgi:hypothetical protein
MTLKLTPSRALELFYQSSVCVCVCVCVQLASVVVAEAVMGGEGEGPGSVRTVAGLGLELLG